MLNDTSTGEDLTPTQYSVLALVRVRGPLGLTELTELEGLNPTMLSRIVKVLDERGLIRRMPDPERPARRARGGDPGGRAGARPGPRAAHPGPFRVPARLPADIAAQLLAAVPALEALAEAVKSPPRAT